MLQKVPQKDNPLPPIPPMPYNIPLFLIEAAGVILVILITMLLVSTMCRK